MVNGTLILLGESFRSGGQHTRERGNPSSVKEQMDACKSHLRFMKSFVDVNWKVRIFTYSTNYDSLIYNNYKNIEICEFIKSEPIGLQNLYNMSIKQIKNYDFVLVCRIDLYLKDMFIYKFNYKWNEVRYPFICWTAGGGNVTTDYQPRVSDTIIFIPKKINLNDINISHEGWYEFIKKGYTVDNIDVMINSFHDSDSAKDYNPLYYIVNRNQTNNWSSKGQVFNKELYRHLIIN